MEFTNLLYKVIGNRIRALRKAKGITQESFERVDTTILSRIENGKAEKTRNPYFINDTHMKTISERLEISPSELVWGTTQERIKLVKMIVLRTLLNDVNNPFSELSIETWIENEWSHRADEQKYLREHLDEAKETYGFFINPQNYVLYESLNSKFEEDYEKVSNLILKQLLQDYKMAKHFSNCLINHTNHSSDEVDKIEVMIKDFLLNKKNYALIVLDKGGIKYPEFIKAFNKFWNKVENEYMDYFNKYLFVEDSKLAKRGMRDIQNDKLHEIITSKDFIKLNERLLLLTEYSDEEAILSSLHIRFEMIHALRKSKNDLNLLSDDFAKSFASIYNAFGDASKTYFKMP